jgi:hypothetical protein
VWFYNLDSFCVPERWQGVVLQIDIEIPRVRNFVTSSRLMRPCDTGIVFKEGIHNLRVSSCQLYPNCKCRDATTNGNTRWHWEREYKISCSWAEVLILYVTSFGVVYLTWYELAMDPARELRVCGKFCTNIGNARERTCMWLYKRSGKKTGAAHDRRIGDQKVMTPHVGFVRQILVRTQCETSTHTLRTHVPSSHLLFH